MPTNVHFILLSFQQTIPFSSLNSCKVLLHNKLLGKNMYLSFRMRSLIYEKLCVPYMQNFQSMELIPFPS